MRKVSGIVARMLAVCAAACMFAGTAWAGVGITFIHEGRGSGTLAGQGFGSQDFKITATGDTGNRQVFGGGFFIDHITAQIEIANVGTFNILTPTRTFVNNGGQIVGFSRAGISGADLFNGPVDAQFGAWDMLSGIGPVAGNGSLLQWSNNPQINTSGGILIFDNGGSPARFTAIIPGPGAIALLGLGAIVARRRRRD